MEVGKNIRHIRKARKITQEELAKKTGISLSTIRRYENGERQPNFEKIAQIAAALGVSTHEITGLQTFDTGADFTKAWNGLTQQHDQRERECLAQMTQNFYKLNTNGQEEAVKRVSELTRLPEFTRVCEEDIAIAHGADGTTTIKNRKTGSITKIEK